MELVKKAGAKRVLNHKKLHYLDELKVRLGESVNELTEIFSQAVHVLSHKQLNLRHLAKTIELDKIVLSSGVLS